MNGFKLFTGTRAASLKKLTALTSTHLTVTEPIHLIIHPRYGVLFNSF